MDTLGLPQLPPQAPKQQRLHPPLVHGARRFSPLLEPDAATHGALSPNHGCHPIPLYTSAHSSSCCTLGLALGTSAVAGHRLGTTFVPPWLHHVPMITEPQLGLLLFPRHPPQVPDLQRALPYTLRDVGDGSAYKYIKFRCL
jgi:hypothetical protein